jgi:hypothetical protein
MSWKRLRLIAFSIGGAAFSVVAGVVQLTGIERAGLPLILTFSSLGALMILILVFDVGYHAWRGDGQACRKCGYIRQMRAFRVYRACPNCGKE